MASDTKKFDSSPEHVEHYEVLEAVQRNIDAKIRNPLLGLTRAELRAQVEQFCIANNFSEREELFQKAAILAQNPTHFEDIVELTEEDKQHLRTEQSHRWRLPRALYLCIAVVSLGSAVQGWDNTGANGANLSFPEEFGIADQPWLIGVINSGPTLFGLLSAWAADPVNNLLGRRGTIFLTGLFVVFPVLAQAFTHNWWELLICRMFMGLGMGIKVSVNLSRILWTCTNEHRFRLFRSILQKLVRPTSEEVNMISSFTCTMTLADIITIRPSDELPALGRVRYPSWLQQQSLVQRCRQECLEVSIRGCFRSSNSTSLPNLVVSREPSLVPQEETIPESIRVVLSTS